MVAAPTERDVIDLLAASLRMPAKRIRGYAASLRGAGLLPPGRRGLHGGPAYLSLKDAVTLLLATGTTDVPKHAAEGFTTYASLACRWFFYEGPSSAGGIGRIWFPAEDLRAGVFPFSALRSLYDGLVWFAAARAINADTVYSVVDIACALGDRPGAQVRIIERGHDKCVADLLYASDDNAMWLEDRLFKDGRPGREMTLHLPGDALYALGDLYSSFPAALGIEGDSASYAGLPIVHEQARVDVPLVESAAESEAR